MTCEEALSIEHMATKMKMMKLLQEIRGMAQFTQRRPQSKAPGLFFLQLRSHVNLTSSRRRWVVPIQMHEMPDIPNPVKITFIKNKPVIPDPVTA